MKRISVFALIAVFTPFVASYGGGSSPSADQPQHNYLSSHSESIIEEDVISENRSNQEPGNTYGDAASGSASSLNQANAQLQDLNANPTYENMKNSEAIAESLAENILASNMRQGKIDIVAPNVITQAAFRSLMVPKAFNNHQVVATQPLQPIVVTQPGVPPAQINSGPPAVVKASPVVYKLKPSVIYQQEIINKIPTPLSLNPVYVKVYKPGKQVNVPMVPARATAASPQYDQNRYAYDAITNNYASSAPYMHGMSSKY